MTYQPNFNPPAPPDPTTVEQWAGQVRTLVAVLSGIFAGVAWLHQITDAQITGYVTFGLTIASLAGWAWAGIKSWQSKQLKAAEERKLQVASAVASANATMATGVATPVTVSVVQKTPPGLPDVGAAAFVSSIEVAMAPKVSVAGLQNPSPPPVPPVAA